MSKIFFRTFAVCNVQCGVIHSRFSINIAERSHKSVDFPEYIGVTGLIPRKGQYMNHLINRIVFTSKRNSIESFKTNNTIQQLIMYKFQAFRISQKDNLLFPDKVEIDDNKVIYYKGRIFGYESTTIQRSNIGSVSVDAGLLFATVVIETNGGQTTRLEGFSRSDAAQIQRILSF